MVHIVLQDNKRKNPPSSPPKSRKKHATVELVDSESEDDDIEIIELPIAPSTEPVEKVNSDLKKLKCPVCLDHPDEMVAADCGHVYCYSCVFQALASTRRATQTFGECSVCRSRVRYDQVHYLQMYEQPSKASAGD